MSARLAVESLAARAAGKLSRLAGAGGGTTLPGKLLWKLDPTAIDALAARLPDGAAVVSATNGKTTTTAMAAEILGPKRRLAWNRSGANLASGVASTLLTQRNAELGLLEVDEGALPEIARRVRPRAVLLGNLFRDQLDRYGELEHIAANWRAATAALPQETVLVVNGDDPQVGDLGRDRAGTIAFGIDDPAHARPTLQHAADSRYCVRCGRPYEFAAAYVGHLGDYHCPACGHARPPLQVRARAIELDGLEGVSFELETPAGSTRVRLPLPGLYNVYNALGAAALAQVLGARLDEIRAGLERFGAAFGRFERIAAGDKTILVLLIKNPAGANEVVHTLEQGGAPSLLFVALNDAIADGQDVSWIWDVDFEPLFARIEHLIASGDRAAELGVRCVYGGLDESALEVESDLTRALDRGLALTPPGGELVVLPTYTAMLALQRILTERGHAKPYWERS
jgi:lipid II isoglutaminyl synthase (glutamine-hydrolysing)